MLAIDLVKIILSAFLLGTIGTMMAFNVEGFDIKGNTLLIYAAIALIIVFHI